MEILIIGGSRFVGPLILNRLLGKGHSVTVFNRGRERRDYGGAKFVKGDRDKGFKEVKGSFDAAIDMCAYEGSQTKTALEGIDADFFLHMGTAAAYRKSERFPLSEYSPLGEWPLWGEYNRGKVECERILKESGRKSASIRPVYILGAANYAPRESFIYSSLKEGRPIVLPGNGEAVVQFVFSQEVAESIATVAEMKAEGAFNCCGDDAVTLRGLVGIMAKISGRKAIIKQSPAHDGDSFDESEFPFANENMLCANSKLKELGVRFIPLEEGLERDYLGYYSK
jgi:nucleoside-diphosphate-sugar epimerase